MRNILLTTMCVFVLSSCGTLRVSKEDRKLINEGKKSLLLTRNRDPLHYLAVIPILIDAFGGKPTKVDIESVDGKEVGKWYRANEQVALEPGMHEVVATWTVEVNDINRAVDGEEGVAYRSATETISYTFEGGKRYRIFALEYLTRCELCIEPD
ncbi:MAG: DUF2057 domain-containing protein [Planctomycetota bacterium]|jgi:hypothetical protein